MSKILLTADQHIHPHSGSLTKLNDSLAAFEWVFKVAEEKGITRVLSLGDLFHDRQKIHTLAYQRAYEILAQAEERGIRTYLLLGNHDMYLRESYAINSLKPLESVAQLITEPATVEIEGLDIDMVPYVEDARSQLPSMFPVKNRSRVMCGHLAVAGGIMNRIWGTQYSHEVSDELSEQAPTPKEVDPGCFEGYEKVFLGHFHSRQCLKDDERINYIGSPLQINFGDAQDPRGISILDTDTLDLEFIENTFSPRYFILPHDSDLKDEQLRGAHVRIVAPSDLGGSDLIELKQKFAESSGAHSVEILTSRSTKTQAVEEALGESIVFTEDRAELLERYLEAVEIPEGLDKKRLLQIGVELTQTLTE